MLMPIAAILCASVDISVNMKKKYKPATQSNQTTDVLFKTSPLTIFLFVFSAFIKDGKDRLIDKEFGKSTSKFRNFKGVSFISTNHNKRITKEQLSFRSEAL